MDKSQIIQAAEDDVPNFKHVSPSLLRGGQPSERGFLHLKELGVKTIVNLRNERWMIRSESELVASLGLKYISIPLSPFAEPQIAEINDFLEVLEDKDNHSVFVHCLHGCDRTGVMISLYRMTTHGWTIRQAYEEMLELGFHPEFSNLTQALIGYSRTKKVRA